MPAFSLPLIDLHRHLDGNIRPKTIWQLAQQHNIALPVTEFDDFLPYVQIQENQPDLISFLKKLDWGVSVLKSLDDVKRIAYENIEDAYLAGIHYTELRFSPYYMALTHQLNMEDVIAAVIDGVQAGVRQFGVKANLIGIMSRSYGAQKCLAELNALLAFKQHIVAIDLAGDELNNPGHLFEPHFDLVRRSDLNVTVHAGEAAGPESVWHAINQLGATRIGHGVASARDPQLMDYLVDHNISIESCLTSNLQTGTVVDLATHPIKYFLDHSVNVCLNTDDPAVEGIELKHEFELARTVVGLNEQQIIQLQKNAITACFLSDSEKQQLMTLSS